MKTGRQKLKKDITVTLTPEEFDTLVSACNVAIAYSNTAISYFKRGSEGWNELNTFRETAKSIGLRFRKIASTEEENK